MEYHEILPKVMFHGLAVTSGIPCVTPAALPPGSICCTTGDFPRIVFPLDQKLVAKHAKSSQVDTGNAGVTVPALSNPKEKRSFQFHQGCAFAPRVNHNQPSSCPGKLDP